VWEQHQGYVALLLLICLIVMTTFFVQRSFVNRGLIEIDRAESLHADFKIDINQAGWEEIILLPGVGEKLAQAIVEYRRKAGSFDSPEALMQVPGIGPKKLERLKPYLLRVSSQSR
jgi:competence protein ComEA